MIIFATFVTKNEIMIGKLQDYLVKELADIREAGLYKKERIIVSPQGAEVTIDSGKEVVIMCANNYLGLSSHPAVIEGAKSALDSHGFGMSSVRFICVRKTFIKHLKRKFPIS